MNEAVIDFLIGNKEHLAELIQPLKMRKELSLGSVPQIFHDDILDQYSEMIDKLICEEIAKATHADAETIMIIVSEWDMKGYLNG